MVDTRIPREPACCHGASKTDVLTTSSSDREFVKPRSHYPIAQASQAADVTPTPPNRGSVSESALSAAPAGLERAEQNRSMPESGRILSQRDEQTLLQHQCRLVGTWAGGRSLVPALLRWGQLALRIRAPQTVLFQDEHGRPWPHLAQSRRPSLR
jgi:hypothetical protein